MNSFYNEEELQSIGFKRIGKNVKISRHACVYGAQNISIGNNVRIDDFTILSGKIEIGDYVHISAYAALFAGSAGIIIEDFAGVSSRTTIYAVSDDYTGRGLTNPTVPDKYRVLQSESVRIKKHAIIGASSIVLPGVTVETGTAVGTMTLINKNTEEWTINVGIPFKKVKDRNRTILELEEELKRELSINE